MITAEALRQTEQKPEEFIDLNFLEVQEALIAFNRRGIKNLVLQGRLSTAHIESFKECGYGVKEVGVYGSTRLNTVISW